MDNACTSCEVLTSQICERHNTALCENCRCEWANNKLEYRHVFGGPGTAFLRYYMSLWPRYLPPPKTKRRARAAVEIVPFVEHMLDTMCSTLQPAWDREDALMSIAEIAVRLHARDARIIDGWNQYVERENVKRKKRKLKGWRNNYYNRIIRAEDKPNARRLYIASNSPRDE